MRWLPSISPLNRWRRLLIFLHSLLLSFLLLLVLSTCLVLGHVLTEFDVNGFGGLLVRVERELTCLGVRRTELLDLRLARYLRSQLFKPIENFIKVQSEVFLLLGLVH